MLVDLTGYDRGTQTISAVQRSLILKTFPGFADLDGRELATMAAISRERFFRKGDTLLEPGRPVAAMYLVVEGETEMLRHGRPWRRFGPQSAIGGLAALTRDPKGAHAVAATHVLTLEIDPEEMEEVFEDNFGIQLAVLSALARTLREAQMRSGRGSAITGRELAGLDADRPLTLIDKMFFLTRSTNFAEASIEAIAELAEGVIEVRIPTGAHLWRAGDRADHSVMLVAGEMEARPPDGEPFTFRPGYVVGGLDSLGRLPRWYDLVAQGDVVALRLDRTVFYDVLEDHPELARHMLRHFAKGIDTIYEQLANEGDG